MSTPPPVPGEHEPLDTLDLDLLDRLAGIWDESDPPPAGMVDRVTFNLTLAGLHAEVAQLQENVAGATREDRPVESMTFSGSRASLMITVAPAEDSEAPVRIDGWVTGGGTTVELVTDESVLSRVADDRGRLVWEDVPRGVVHFVIRAEDPGEPSTLTPRVEI